MWHLRLHRVHDVGWLARLCFFLGGLRAKSFRARKPGAFVRSPDSWVC